MHTLEEVAPAFIAMAHRIVWCSAATVDTGGRRASWGIDDETKRRIWDLFKNAPAPVGYDLSIVPVWDSPTASAYAVLRLEPWRLRVMPGTVMTQQVGEALTWQEASVKPPD